jgi:hypothetical protein
MSYQEPELNFDAADSVDNKGSFRDFNNFKLVDGANIYRILPPFGTGHNGVWFAEWYLHWGFQNENGSNVPLACSYRTDERYCPICEEANEIRAKMDALVKDYTTDKKTDWEAVPPAIQEKYYELRPSWNDIKAQRGYYYNALNQANEVGILRLTPKTGKALNEKIKEAYNKKSIHALSLTKGIFFNIYRKRTGKRAFDVEYSVDFFREEVEIEGHGVVEKIREAAVPETIAQNFESLAYDIHKMYTLRTAAELKKIMLGEPVGSSSGNSNGATKTTVDSSEVAAAATAVGNDEEQLAALRAQLGMEGE